MLALGFSLSAQTGDDIFSENNDEDLFWTEETLIEERESSTSAMDELLLVDDEVVKIGGGYNLGFTTGGTLDPGSAESFEDIIWGFAPDLSGSLYLDARPDADTRVFAKAELSYPFTIKEDDPATPMIDESRGFDDIVNIKELFSDFNIDDTVFFRAGKQTINWGVGYYFSPADLLNLTQIDPENPDVELEGPLSVKMHLPLDSNNYYLYVVVPEDIKDPSDLAFAPKAELVFGDNELGIGAYYRYEQAPAAMMTLTTSINDISLFSEVLLKYGSDKTFVTCEDGLYALKNYNDRIFFSATLGASYMWSSEESDVAVRASGQYLFNGEGYADTSFLSSTTGSAFIGSSVLAGDLSLHDLTTRSMHYGAASISVFPVEDISFSVLWLGNFTDFSGMVRPGITWQASESISLGIDFPWTYGDKGDEYTPQGSIFSFNIGVSLGSALF